MKQTRVVFFGTPDFAVPTLRQLIEQYTVVGCVTQPDKPVGRKQVLTPPPTKVLAQQHGIPVLQPKTLKQTKEEGQQFLHAFTALQPDIAVLIAYGKIVPQEVLNVPKHGFVNLHLSLLPAYRGASPVQYAIMDGAQETGVTLMKMDEGMDTGDLIAQERIKIEPTDTSGTVYEKVGTLSGKMVHRYLDQYLNGTLTPQPQDHAAATSTGLLSKSDGEIDWSMSPEQIERKIRALTPWPGTFTFCNNKRIKILSAHLHLNEAHQLVIDTVQPEGKKPMPYSDFFKGNPDCPLPPQ